MNYYKYILVFNSLVRHDDMSGTQGFLMLMGLKDILRKATSVVRVRTNPKRFVASYVSYDNKKGQPTELDFKILYDTFKKSPEVVGAISAIVEDVLADGYDLVPVEADEKMVEKMEQHLSKISFHKKLKTALLDLLITGNSYIEYKVISDEELEQLLTNINIELKKNFDYEIKKDLVLKQTLKEFIPFNLFNIDASTVKIDYDEHGRVKAYVQKIPNKPESVVRLKPEEVIHLTLMSVGGNPYGFTPLQSLVEDIATLIFAKNYSGDYFEHGGQPNFLYIFPDAYGEEDRNVQALKHMLEEIKQNRLRHKDIILTGNVDVKQINNFNKDMEYKELIKHFTQIILMAFGVPPSRVALPEGAGKQISREFNEGYYKKINSLQVEIEDALNNHIFRKYGLRIRFKRTYKVDELREAQIAVILVQNGILSVEEARQRLGYLGAIEPQKPKRPARELPHRDVADRQEGGRGRGEDRGRRLTTSLDEYETKKFDDFVMFVKAIGTNVHKIEQDDKVILYSPIHMVKTEVRKDVWNVVKDVFDLITE